VNPDWVLFEAASAVESGIHYSLHPSLSRLK
jgi:hypothetical protein